MQKFNEKALVLQDACLGIMTKVSFLRKNIETPGSRPHALSNDNWSRVRKTVEKAFPDRPDLSAVKGFETFQQGASQVCDELQDIYLTFVDLMDLLDASKDLLATALHGTVHFRTEQNRVVIAHTMNLFTSFVKLHLVMDAFSDRRVLTGLYAAAYHCVHGSSEPQVARVAHQIQDFEDPLKRLINEVEAMNVAELLFDVCLALKPAVDTYLHTEGLRQKNMLNPTEEAGGLALPVRQELNVSHPKLSLHAEMRDAHRYMIWTIYVGLVTPELMLREDRQFLNLFNTVARHYLLVPVFRGQTLNVHQATEELAKWFPPRGYKIQPPKELRNLKKMFKDESKAATVNCGHAHAEKRSYLRGEMANLVSLLMDTPGLVGPKFPMVLTALAMGKAELRWYFDHKSATTRRDRQKHLNLSDFDDPYISTLLGLQDQLVLLVREFRRYVSVYYIEYLQGAHRTRLARLLEAARPHLDSEGNAISSILSGLLPEIDRLDVAAPDEADLVGFRLDWARCVACFTSMQSAAHRPAPVIELLEAMDRITTHSRFVDDIEGLLVEYGELSELWWHHDHLALEFERALNDTVELPRSSYSNGLRAEGIAHFTVAYMRTAACAMENISAFCPEEQRQLGDSISRYVEDLMGAIARRVRDLVDPLYAQLLFWSDYLQPVQAAYRLQRIQEAKARGEEVSKEIPGWESHAYRVDYIKDLVVTERNLNRLLDVISKTPRLVVNDRIFAPKEFVRRELQRYVEEFIASVVLEQGGDGIAQPSVALRRVEALVAALQHTAGHIPLDVQKLVRRVLFDQALDTAYYVPDADPDDPDAAPLVSGGTKMVHRFAAFYASLVEEMRPGGRNAGVCFVEIQHTFVRMPGASGGAVDAERYCDAAELEAVCTLVGPHGVRVIDGKLLELVAAKVEIIKQFMTHNMPLLERFRAQHHTPQWSQPVRSMQGLESFMACSIVIGNALCLRRLLHDALAKVQSERVPFLSETVRVARESVLDTFADVTELVPLDNLAQDCGIESPLSDARLRHAIQHISSAATPDVWTLLPYAWASCLLCPQWSQTRFIAGLDIFTGNEHVIAVTIRKLVICMQPPRDVNTVNPTVLQEAFRSYMKVASFVLLRMKMFDTSDFAAYPLRAMTLLLEKFVGECPFLERSMLEAYMPYAILHNAYMDISLRKQRASDTPITCQQAFAEA
uniref:CYRIA/CYRIB Rac1 binding domain-containing protein n=1 Tax=Phaeomonas parva TaxID=124430 RepID=A0A7S1XR57_9STRA|mmetsp:Transcript_31450/g.99718  ORF Transcript_31450/g.99718 Transcript_31450/m.99718 type:complete len:1190 (+) Transcript_31450:198-3767(+)